MGGPYEKTTPFPFPSERFPQGIAPSYLADLTYETAVAAKVLADAILEAKSDDTAEIEAQWFKLTGDARFGRCATEHCGGQPTERMEGGGVGSNYCSGCAASIKAIRNRGTEND